MTSHKIFVTGASGLVGSYFLRHLITKFDTIVVTVHESLPEFGELVRVDLLDLDSLTRKLNQYNPEIIVNLAALTNVDKCEESREYAYHLNTVLTKILSKFSKSRDDTYILHMSTDYVFDGREGNYSENDKPNPINWYGQTKLKAESEVTIETALRNACILRTSTPFGFHPKKTSFVQYVIESIKAQKELKVFSDQITSPTYSNNLAKMMVEIIERRISGILHTAGNSRLSRFDQALKIADLFSLDKNLITATKMEDMNMKARRPHDSSLNVTKAISLLSNKPLTFDSALKEYYLQSPANI